MIRLSEKAGWFQDPAHRNAAIEESLNYELFGQEPPSHERERQCGCVIQPLGIVDQAEERRRLGGVGQQAENREADQKAIGSCAQAQTEGRGERVVLRRRQPLETIQQSRTHLVQTGKGELHFRFHACCANDLPALSALSRILQ
jgi:hypothetical protein